MSLTMDYNHNVKILYSDNTFVGRTKWGSYYLSIHVTERGASIGRYCVPGRIDTYHFDWIPGNVGIGSRVALFTDTGASLENALKLVKKDLKKKEVKLLLTEANTKLGERSHLASLLNALR